MKKTVKDSEFVTKIPHEKAVNKCFCEYLSKLPCYAVNLEFLKADII